jgi:hypothetical protein
MVRRPDSKEASDARNGPSLRPGDRADASIVLELDAPPFPLRIPSR